MRIPRDRLIFLGLVALDEVMRGCATAPAKPSPALRVVLAMLFQLSDGKDRRVFVLFWRDCQLAPSETLTEYTANHVRTTELRKCWNRICTTLGVEQTPELARHRRREPPHGNRARGAGADRARTGRGQARVQGASAAKAAMRAVVVISAS